MIARDLGGPRGPGAATGGGCASREAASDSSDAASEAPTPEATIAKGDKPPTELYNIALFRTSGIRIESDDKGENTSILCFEGKNYAVKYEFLSLVTTVKYSFRQQIINEYVSAPLYEILLGSRAPKVKLGYEILKRSKDGLFAVCSEYIDGFVNLKDYKSTLPCDYEPRTAAMRQILNTERVLLASLLLMERDPRQTNLGVVKEDFEEYATTAYVMAKVDHGWSLSNYSTNVYDLFLCFTSLMNTYRYSSRLTMSARTIVKIIEEFTSTLTVEKFTEIVKDRLEHLKELNPQIYGFTFQRWANQQFYSDVESKEIKKEYFKIGVDDCARPKDSTHLSAQKIAFDHLLRYYTEMYSHQHACFLRLRDTFRLITLIDDPRFPDIGKYSWPQVFRELHPLDYSHNYSLRMIGGKTTVECAIEVGVITREKADEIRIKARSTDGKASVTPP